MQEITVYTLFDITNTKIIRRYKKILMDNHPDINSEAQWIMAKNQQNNFETLMQIISLRAQPTLLYKPRKKDNKWVFSFTVEFDDVYLKDSDKLGLLRDDCKNVPMINLLQSKITDSYLILDKNIFFEVKEYDI